MGCLFLLFFLVFFPYAEFMVMGKVAARVGAFHTILLLFSSAVLGVSLAKQQGIVILQQIQASLVERQPPTAVMVDGLLVFLGGALFVLPGFISDILGLILVFPLTRFAVRWGVLRGFQAHVLSSRGRAGGGASVSPRSKPAINKGGAVDAEVIE